MAKKEIKRIMNEFSRAEKRADEIEKIARKNQGINEVREKLTNKEQENNTLRGKLQDLMGDISVMRNQVNKLSISK
jgi:predicted nuclease with TOPRIM domain